MDLPSTGAGHTEGRRSEERRPSCPHRQRAGLGLGGIIPIAAALTVEYSPPHRRSLNYGLMYSGYSLGILAAALCAVAAGEAKEKVRVEIEAGLKLINDGLAAYEKAKKLAGRG